MIQCVNLYLSLFSPPFLSSPPFRFSLSPSGGQFCLLHVGLGLFTMHARALCPFLLLPLFLFVFILWVFVFNILYLFSHPSPLPVLFPPSLSPLQNLLLLLLLPTALFLFYLYVSRLADLT